MIDLLMPLKVAAAFDKMGPFLKEQGDALVKKVGHTYHFEIAPAKGKPAEFWTVDLKNGSGSIKSSKEGKADATFAMVDQAARFLYECQLIWSPGGLNHWKVGPIMLFLRQDFF